MNIKVSRLEINPVHGVLAEATVRIGDLLTLRSVQLVRNSHGKYSVAFPSVGYKNSPYGLLHDNELANKILDSFKACYHKKISTSKDNLGTSGFVQSEQEYMQTQSHVKFHKDVLNHHKAYKSNNYAY